MTDNMDKLDTKLGPWGFSTGEGHYCYELLPQPHPGECPVTAAAIRESNLKLDAQHLSKSWYMGSSQEY